MAYTWLQFRNQVKSLMSDATLNDTSAVVAISEFIKLHIAREVDKDPQRAADHRAQWLIQKDRLLGYAVTLDAATLRAELDKHLTVDAVREGPIQNQITSLIAVAKNEIAGAATFIDQFIRQGVIDIQSKIDLYRRNQERVFTIGDATEDGEASRLTIPDEAMIQDVFYVNDDADCDRMPVYQYPWQDRYDLVCGNVPLNGYGFFAAIDPTGKNLIVYPSLQEGYHLSVFYDGLKLSFADGDTVPFDEGMALAVADYVRSRMYVTPPYSNPKLAAVFDESFRGKRRDLYLDAKDKVRIRWTNDSRYPLGKCTCSTCSEEDESGSGSGGAGGCSEFKTVASVQVMKELASAPCRKIIFILGAGLGLRPEKIYEARYGDTTPADEPAIIESVDGLTRYFEYGAS